MARRRRDGKPETHARPGAPDPLVFGEGRIGAGWIGIGIAACAVTLIAAALLAAGAPGPLAVIGPLCLAFGLACAVTRQVRIDPEAGAVAVTRRLLGRGWTRRRRLDRFRAVAVTMSIFRSRHAVSDGTVAGDQMHMHYELALRGRGRIRLTSIHRPEAPGEAAEEAEALALALAARLGLTAERHGYVREPGPDGRVLSVPRRRHTEPIAADQAGAAASASTRLSNSGSPSVPPISGST